MALGTAAVMAAAEAWDVEPDLGEPGNVGWGRGNPPPELRCENE